MTRKEITEIFAILMLAFPRSEMFKGGMAKLGPTIELWATCLPDVDFWVGQQAMLRICKESVFPPTIAEFRTAAEAVTKEVNSSFDMIFNFINMCSYFNEKSPQETYEKLREGSIHRILIDAIGGAENAVKTYERDGEVHQAWDKKRLRAAYWEMTKNNHQLPGDAIKALPHKGGSDRT